MNKTLQTVFLWLLPFYPLWAFLVHSTIHVDLWQIVNLGLILVILYKINSTYVKVPPYLGLFFLFTIYHIYSVFSNHLVPREANLVSFLLDDFNISASLMFFVIENTEFEDGFITKLTKNIFFIVIISVLVSVIQIRDVTFFISPLETSNPDKMAYFFDDHRNYSIFSWVDLNSLGITFPIMIAILLNYYEQRTFALAVIVLSSILVSFLSRTRYMMVSCIVVLLHLLFTSGFSWVKRISIVALIVISALIMGAVASRVGIDMKQIINERILEKGEDISTSSAGARVTSYNVFVQKFPEHPWFGVGPHTREDVVSLLGEGVPIIHVGYLSYLYYYGIVGCFFLFLSLAFLLIRAFLVGLKFKFWGSFYGLLSFCLANATFVYFNLNEAGIVLAILYLRYYKLIAQRSKSTDEYEYIEAEPVIRL
jgi:hypothetical protein